MELEKLKKIIQKEMNLGTETEIHMESRFVEDLGADSLDVVQIVMAIEEEFGIEIPEDAAEKIRTVGEAAKAIRKATGEVDG